MPNESSLTRDVVKFLNSIADCHAFRVHGGPHQRIGTLDINGCYKGRFFGIEMKLPGKEKNLTDIQASTIRKIHRAGGAAGVATDKTGALNILKEAVLNGRHK